jgi:hypothetical protein
VLEVLEERSKETLMAWLKAARESGLLSALEEVTTDMWDGYVQAVAEVFGPMVRIVIDRFHVMKNFSDCLTKARREAQKQLPPQAATELKGTRWLWMTNPENLEEEERRKLEQIKEKFPPLAALSRQREELNCVRSSRTARSPLRREAAPHCDGGWTTPENWDWPASISSARLWKTGWKGSPTISSHVRATDEPRVSTAASGRYSGEDSAFQASNTCDYAYCIYLDEPQDSTHLAENPNT